MKQSDQQDYEKPTMVKLDNLKDLTLECPEFQCSIGVPPPPPAP